MADVVQVRLLGGFEASSGERSVAPGAWRLRKAKTLIKLLSLEPSHRVHRDQVIDALWPGLDPHGGRNNLHQVVHSARKALATIGVDGSAVLGLHDDLFVLGAGVAVRTDVEELQYAVETARAAGQHDEAARVLREHPGELLPEDAYEPWVQAHATRFREWRTQQVMDVVDAQVAAGHAELAVVLLAPVVAAEPLHEPASRALMKALAASGRRSEALLTYERLRNVLSDELAADPEPETRQVFRDLLTGGPAPTVTVPTPRSAVAGNLPAAVTALVGRSRELTETAAILGRTRLLTFTGMGGVGKTALAVELARRQLTDYPDGVYLVELGALNDGDQVAPQIARAAQLALPPDSSPVESMIAQLGRRRLLIVLDNCEHLLDACALVVRELLRGCPELSILATSREMLRIEGEVSWRIPSLQLPDPSVPCQLPELAAIASVELFVQRAAAALPSFTLTDDNAQAVADICYRLDGIPLAVELAASCVTTLSAQQIADRLNDALNLLRRGDRATITRQQTLTATLAWSHDLLDDDERVLFRRLSVFAGSFTLDAVESVCGDGLGEPQVLVALARLVDTSLAVAEFKGDVARYRLLDTVRQYAAEKLRGAGEQSELQRRHCDWYLRFAQQYDPERAPVATGVSSGLDVEHDNMRAALAWSLQQRPPVALELAVALWRYWLARGFFAEGRRWLEAVLAAAPQPTAQRARTLIALAVFDVRRGNGGRLPELGAEAISIHRSLGRPEGLAQALQADAVLAYMRGSWDESWQRSLEAREVAAGGAAPQFEVAARHLQALLLLSRGRLTEAETAFGEVRTGLQDLPAATAPFLPPVQLGYAVQGAAVGKPRIYFEETVLLGRVVGAEQADAYLLCYLADVARLGGDLDAALASLDDAAGRFVGLGDHEGEAFAANRLGCLHRIRGEFAKSRAALDHSLRLRRGLGDRRAVGLTLANLGLLVAAEGDTAAGRALVAEQQQGFAGIQDRAGHVGLTLTLASIDADSGDAETAGQLLAVALPQFEGMPGNHRATAWGYAMLVDVLTTLGRPDDADQARRQASRIFEALAIAGAPTLLDPAGAGRSAMQSRR